MDQADAQFNFVLGQVNDLNVSLPAVISLNWPGKSSLIIYFRC